MAVDAAENRLLSCRSERYSAEVVLGDPAASKANVPAAIGALTRAIEHLEEALVERERITREEARRMQELRREAEALRSLQHTVAHRLNAAIARLKETIGD